jgi:hypothetical protein
LRSGRNPTDSSLGLLLHRLRCRIVTTFRPATVFGIRRRVLPAMFVIDRNGRRHDLISG